MEGTLIGLAVVIGVGRVKGLDFLPGVASGVSGFAEWARTQRFDVVEHSDVDGDSVDAGSIAQTIRDRLGVGDLEQLFVYFAGHGIGTGGETWLLSDAGQDSNAGINVTLSQTNARQCGVHHVAFFADACRVPESGDGEFQGSTHASGQNGRVTRARRPLEPTACHAIRSQRMNATSSMNACQ